MVQQYRYAIMRTKDKNLRSNAITDKYYHKCGKLDIGNKIKVNYYRKRMVRVY